MRDETCATSSPRYNERWKKTGTAVTILTGILPFKLISTNITVRTLRKNLVDGQAFDRANKGGPLYRDIDAR